MRHRGVMTLRDWLGEDSFSLALSAGFFGFFAHAGLLSALEDEGLVPRRLSGASAGALVAGLWSAGLDGDALKRELYQLRRKDFWDPGLGFGVLKGALFLEKLEALTGSRRFEDCRVPLSISVYDLAHRRTTLLREGDLASAVKASCTVPGLFHPTRREGRVLLDGGILDRPALAGLEDESRILCHHLASRSPWRRRSDPALVPPRRLGLIALVFVGLARAGPFRLDAGRMAFAQARRAMFQALKEPVVDGRVVVNC